MSSPFSEMRPDSQRKTPAMAFSRLDLPAPFEPMTVTNSPGWTNRLSSCSATISSSVPWKKVLVSDWTCNMLRPEIEVAQQPRALRVHLRNDERNQHQPGCHQLEIAGPQPGAQGQ